jgi:hypothetical protein
VLSGSVELRVKILKMFVSICFCFKFENVCADDLFEIRKCLC